MKRYILHVINRISAAMFNSYLTRTAASRWQCRFRFAK